MKSIRLTVLLALIFLSVSASARAAQDDLYGYGASEEIADPYETEIAPYYESESEADTADAPESEPSAAVDEAAAPAEEYPAYDTYAAPETTPEDAAEFEETVYESQSPPPEEPLDLLEPKPEPAPAPEPKMVGPTAPPPSFTEEFEKDPDAEILARQSAESKRGTEEALYARDTMVSKEERVDYYPEQPRKAETAPKDELGGGHVKMSGMYRMAFGAYSDHFFLNESNADFQERNFRYIFGEDLNNTFDPAVYSKYLLNVDFSPVDRLNFYTQIVADPWSWVGTTGLQETRSVIDPNAILKYNLKYFGAFNGTLNEIYRTHYSDAIAFPIIKVNNGHLTPGTVVHGFFDFVPATGGVPYNIAEHEIDYTFRPVRKLWADFDEDQWHVRVFMFADQSQALSTDDPLELSNHKDYWQQSPWLYQYEPIQFFTDHSILRGQYSDVLSFMARDSEGNRLTLLRGASFEGDFGSTYVAATVASPYTPWHEDYYSSLISDNVSTAARVKHWVSDDVMIGSTYTHRAGLIDDSIADENQVFGFDVQWNMSKAWTFKGEAAGSYNDRDRLTDERLRIDREGYAYKAIFEGDYDHTGWSKIFDGHTNLKGEFTWMDEDFNPNLSRYSNTRDDHFWGNHLTFYEYTPDIEHFRLGDGVDINRYVFHIRWKEKFFKEKFENLFDVRNVHRASNSAYMETVLRDEMTLKATRQTTWKALIRWHGLPKSNLHKEPFLSNFYFPNTVFNPSDVTLLNIDIPEGRDTDRWTYSIGMQHVFSKELTLELFVERTSDIPDFPRGLLNGTFRNTNINIDGVLHDNIATFLYGQDHLKATPPYKMFTIVREHIIYRPEERVTYTLHAAQNGYKFWGGIDDNINHVGVSMAFEWLPKVSFFADYTYSQQIDLPKLINTGFREADYRGHHNFYVSMDYKIHPTQILRAEYGVFGLGTDSPLVSPYSTTGFSLPTIDTEHLFRVSLTGDF